MTTHATTQISSYIAEPLRVEEPDVAGPLAVFPLFGPDPELDYRSFAQGRDAGVAIKEIQSAARVNDLLVANPTDKPVLLYEGEEVLGAQQNRTFDITVLVAAGATIKVPVSCVEAGRWDHRRHSEDFDVAPQAAYPELRRAKNQQVREHLALGLEARAAQSAVWDAIDAKSRRHGSRSPTGAMHDLYESRRGRLNELTRSIGLHDGQIGALAAIGGQFSVLDCVSRPDVFAAMHGPLIQGYALDALESDEADPPSIESARGFVSLVIGSEPSERDGIGLGRELRFASDGIAGSGLVHETELVHLTAFPEEQEK
jgi:ARG/rhodanese/phosphatase superfamily protein